MKKYIGIALIVLAIILGWVVFTKNKSKSNTVEVKPSTALQLSTLPTSWTQISTTPNMKFEKQVNAGLKPQIVFVKTNSKDALTPAKYVDRLKAGARSTVTGLAFTDDRRTSDPGIYTAKIAGYYYYKKIKINVLQRVYIKGEEVNTMTGSFTGDLSTEVNQIFDTISKEKVSL